MVEVIATDEFADFYWAMVATSERIWKGYLAEQKRGEHNEE